MARPMELKALAVILSGKEIPNLMEFAQELRLSAKSRVSAVSANLKKKAISNAIERLPVELRLGAFG